MGAVNLTDDGPSLSRGRGLSPREPLVGCRAGSFRKPNDGGATTDGAGQERSTDARVSQTRYRYPARRAAAGGHEESDGPGGVELRGTVPQGGDVVAGEAAGTGTRLSSRQAYVLLAAVVFAFGINWPIITIGLRSTSPLWLIVFRIGGATAVVFAFNVAAGRLRLPHRGDWPIVLSIGLPRIAAVGGIVFVALQYVPPGRSSVLVWTASLWTVPIAAAVLHERMSPRRWTGLIIGVGGILLLFEPWRFAWSNRDVVLGHGLLLLAALLNAVTSVHLRRHDWHAHPLDVLPWQLLLAALTLLAAALAFEGAPVVAWSWGFGANVFWQAVVASAFAIWGHQTVLRRLEAIAATVPTMAIPVVGLLSSVLILGESVSLVGGVGVVSVLAGVALSLTAEPSTATAAV